VAEVLVISNRGNLAVKEGLYVDDEPVVVRPDDHPWGREERNTAKFRIVKYIGERVSNLIHLEEPSVNNSRRRDYRIDLLGRITAV
jgi:hypothetical protein